jgi:hypothetical protein
MRHKRVLWLALSLVFVMMVACFGSGTLSVGTSAPNFGFKVGDKTKTLEDYRGNVVIVNFWSST